MLISLGLAGLTYALVEAGGGGLGDPVVVAAGVAGCVLLVAFLLFERRVSAPMLPLTIFRSRQFSVPTRRRSLTTSRSARCSSSWPVFERASKGGRRLKRVSATHALHDAHGFGITAGITPSNSGPALIAPSGKNPAVAGFFHAPERTRTSTAFTGHKALNLVVRGP